WTDFDEFLARYREQYPPRTRLDEEERCGGRFESAWDWSVAQDKVPCPLVSQGQVINNSSMNIKGRVHNGVVVLEDGPVLPEGLEVTVSYPGPATIPVLSKRRIQVPLVRTGEPGSVHLTGERIAEILDQEDVSPRR